MLLLLLEVHNDHVLRPGEGDQLILQGKETEDRKPTKQHTTGG